MADTSQQPCSTLSGSRIFTVASKQLLVQHAFYRVRLTDAEVWSSESVSGRRLCVLQVACVRVEERETAQLLTHQLAVNCVTRVLTGWQQLLRAHTHWRQHTLQGCWAYWAYWAPAHKARNAGGHPV